MVLLVLPDLIVSCSFSQLLNTKKIGTVYVAHKRQVHWQAIHTVHNASTTTTALYTVRHSALIIRYLMYEINSVGLVVVVLGQRLAVLGQIQAVFSTKLDSWICQDRLKICLRYVPDMSQICFLLRERWDDLSIFKLQRNISFSKVLRPNN